MYRSYAGVYTAAYKCYVIELFFSQHMIFLIIQIDI